MNIWIINQYARLDDAPMSSRHLIMARLLSEAGLKSTVVHGKYPAVGAADQEVDSIALPFLPSEGNGVRRVISMFSFGASVLTLLRTRVKNRPDLIVASSPHLFGALGALLLAKMWRRPFVLEIRDIWPRSIEVMMGLSKKHPLILLFAWIEKILYRNSDGFVLLFAGTREHIAQVASGAPVDRWVEIPNAVEVAATPYQPWGGRLDGAPLKVSYVGTVGIPNELVNLVEAVTVLKARGTDQKFRFRVVGDGVEQERLAKMASDRGLDSLRFDARIPKSQVPSALAESDVLLICQKDTSLYEFGLSPNKLSDYAASGRPIISCLRSKHDPVKIANAGWSIPPEDPEALADTLEAINSADKDVLRGFGENSRAYAESTLDWNRNISRLVEFFNGFMENASCKQSK